MLLPKIGMVLNIAQFTYGIIKDIAKLQNPKTHSIAAAKIKKAEAKAKQELEDKGHKFKDASQYVGKAVKQREMWIKRQKQNEQKDE